MMTSELPEPGSRVELTADAEPVGGVKVVHVEDAVVTLSLSPTAVPGVGASVTLRWPAGPRGRYALSAEVLAVGRNRVDVRSAGAAEIEQQRNFVRGGGGEPILLRRPGRAEAQGWVRDISEQGVRARFGGLDVRNGDEVQLAVELGTDTVDLQAVVAKVATLRQQVPPGPMSVELVAVFTAEETQAQIIRRYVLQQQLMARSRF
jgi:hypothetical protein